MKLKSSLFSSQRHTSTHKTLQFVSLTFPWGRHSPNSVCIFSVPHIIILLTHHFWAPRRSSAQDWKPDSCCQEQPLCNSSVFLSIGERDEDSSSQRWHLLQRCDISNVPWADDWHHYIKDALENVCIDPVGYYSQPFISAWPPRGKQKSQMLKSLILNGAVFAYNLWTSSSSHLYITYNTWFKVNAM